MGRFLSLVLIACLFNAPLCSAEGMPKDIKIFTQLSKADDIVDMTRDQFPNTKIDVYLVDQKQDIEDSFNSKLPYDKYQHMNEDEIYKDISERIKAFAPHNTLKIMKSTLGVSYMRIFKITEVPAILMDNYYVTYGLSLSKSIKIFKRQVR